MPRDTEEGETAALVGREGEEVEKEEEVTEVKPLFSFCFLVNSIMGVGILGLPHTFKTTGVISGVILLVMIYALLSITALWVVRAMQAMTMKASASSGHVGKMDMCQMVGILYGPWAYGAVALALSLYMFGLLWSYAALLASSLTAALPLWGQKQCNIYTDASDECGASYVAWVIVLACVLVPLSCLRLRHQSWLQAGATSLRLFLVMLLVGECVRMLSDGQGAVNSGHVDGMALGGDGSNAQRVALWGTFFQIVNGVAVSTFAFATHQALPETLEGVQDPKVNAPRVTLTAFAFCLTCYVTVGVLVVLVFGTATLPVCTLHWAHAGSGVKSMFSMLLHGAVVAIPVLDVMSSFPINVICIADNVRGGAERLFPKLMGLTASTRSMVFCVITGLPPFLGAAFEHDLSTTLAYTGLLGLPACLVVPPLLWWGVSRSESHVAAVASLPSSKSTHPRVFWPALVCCVLFCLAALLLGQPGHHHQHKPCPESASDSPAKKAALLVAYAKADKAMDDIMLPYASARFTLA